MKEITELLIKQRGYHVGLYDLMLEFQMGVGPVGPNPATSSPGIVAGVTRIGIVKTEATAGIGVADAAVVNPLPKPAQ